MTPREELMAILLQFRDLDEKRVRTALPRTVGEILHLFERWYKQRREDEPRQET